MKRTFILGGILLALGALSTPVEAQMGVVRGKVVDSQGKGLPEVTVLVEFKGEMTRKYELKTDKDGDYMQAGLSSGLWRFTASKEGYRPIYLEERVGSGDDLTLPDIQLKTRDEVAKEQGRPTTETMKKFAEAVELVKSEKYGEAEAAFKAILEEAPKLPEAHQNLAYVYARQEKWKDAEAHYLKALEQRPGDTSFTAGLAAVYMQTGREDEASALMNQATGDKPEDATVHFNNAVFLVNSGKVAEAISEFEAALRIDPAMAEAHFHAGTLLVGEGKTTEALEHLEKYLSMNPQDEQNAATAKALIETLKK